MRREPAADRTRDDGFTLIELVVAMVVLGIMAVAVIGVVMGSQGLAVSNRARVAAANLAGREIDIVREEFTRSSSAPMEIANAGTVVNPHPLPGQPAGEPLVVDGKAYTVTRTAAWNITGDGESACEGGSLVMYPTLRVTVSVTWAAMGSVQPVTSSATYAPRKDDGVQGTESFVAVSVTNAAGAPYPGRGVRITSLTESRTGTTDASGCAVVMVQPAATGTEYTAELTDAGMVDISGTPNPSKAVGRLARGELNSSVTFAYDRAGTVNLRFVDGSGTPVPDAAVVGGEVTLVGSDFSGTSAAQVLPITGATMQVTGLWPTSYGAFFGTEPPLDGYESRLLGPGTTLTLDVPLPSAPGDEPPADDEEPDATEPPGDGTPDDGPGGDETTGPSDDPSEPGDPGDEPTTPVDGSETVS